jgi:poly-beta-1,6-N-acetyl-D-glucosamine synthase
MPGSTPAWILFLASAAAVCYVIIGYPLLLAFLARVCERPVRKQEFRRPVTVIVAVRNGERWVGRKIESVLALDYPRQLLELIIVSDGSTDKTDAIVRSYASEGVRLLSVPHGGKPAALNAAVPHADGEFLFLTDVRQLLAPDCLKKLVATMADPDVGVASGNLLIRKGDSMEEFSTGLYWRYENWIRRNLSRFDSMLGATGPVYLIRRSLFVPIPPDSLLDDVYLPMTAHLKGYRLIQEESAIAIDEPTDVKSEFRRKLRTQAGIVQFLTTFPGWFTSANRMRLAFVSLKIGRLLLPLMLAVLLASSLLLPGYWKLAAIPQVAFWLVALSDRLLPQELRLKKLTAPAGAFAALVMAAMLAWKVLFVPPRELWVEARKI